MPKSTCALEECEEPMQARGWCARHYDRWYRTGSPDLVYAASQCLWCGDALKDDRRTDAKYCSVACRARKSDSLRPRTPKPAKQPELRECVACGSEFLGLRRSTCSSRCYKRMAPPNKRPCSVEGCLRPHVAKGYCNHHYKANSPNAKKWSKGNPETRRASLRRKTQKRRALLRTSAVENVDRDLVGERDGWKCGLCGVRVDVSLRWPDPMSASLDHILPLSVGGEHTWANVQISHLRCNVLKGNRGGGEQLRLVG